MEDEAKKSGGSRSQVFPGEENGNDPNWGRIIHAVGYCGAKVDEEKIDIDIAGFHASPRRRQADTRPTICGRPWFPRSRWISI